MRRYPPLLIPTAWEECYTYYQQMEWLKKNFQELRDQVDNLNWSDIDEVNNELDSINRKLVNMKKQIDSMATQENIRQIEKNIADLQAEMENKQNQLTFDSTPTAGSTNPVTSEGIKKAIDDKEVFLDDTVTMNSQNGVKSSGIYTYVNTSNAEMEGNLQEILKDVDANQAAISTLESTTQSLSGTQATQAADITSLKTTQASHSESIATAEDSIELINQDIEQLQNETSEHTTKITALETSQGEQDAKIEGLETTTTAHTASITTLQTDTQDLDTKLSKLKDDTDTEASQTNVRLSAIETTQGQQATQLQGVETAQTEQAGLIAQLQTKNTEQDAAIAKNAEDIKSLDPSDMTARIAAVEEKNTEQDAAIAKNAADIKALDPGDMTSRITALETSQVEQDTKITALETSQGEQDTKITALETSQGEQDTKITALKTTQATHTEALGVLDTDVVDLKNTVNGTEESPGLTGRVKTVENTLNGAGEAQGVVAKVANLDSEMQTANADINGNKLAIEGINSQLTNHSQELDDDAADISALEAGALALGNRLTTVENAINGTETVPGLKQQIAGKQDSLTFDDTPTENSENPVTSNGIYQALANAGGGSGVSATLAMDSEKYSTHGFCALMFKVPGVTSHRPILYTGNIIFQKEITNITNRYVDQTVIYAYDAATGESVGFAVPNDFTVKKPCIVAYGSSYSPSDLEGYMYGTLTIDYVYEGGGQQPVWKYIVELPTPVQHVGKFIQYVSV